MNLSSRPFVSRRLRGAFTLLTLIILAMIWTSAALADDRELLRDRTADPYVFILFDTSGSMHWTPPCTEDDARDDIDPWDMHCTSVCPFDDPTCARVCPNEGCIEYAQDRSATTPQEVIVDNGDSSNVSFNGGWDRSASGGLNGDYLFLSSGERGDITFTADLPEEGEYQVYARWVRRSHRAENVQTTITHADGSDYLEIDQADNRLDDQFNFLGTFRFEDDPDTSEFDVLGVVTISNRNADGGSTAADAVRFSRLPRPDDSSLVCNAYGYRCQQPLCPQGDCQAPLAGDDPTSKFFQARQALDEVLAQVPNVNFGFASFEQDQAALLFKHTLFRYSETRPDGQPQSEFNDFLGTNEQIDFTWPVTGTTEVLGTGAPYNSTSGLSQDNGMFNCDNTTLNPGDNGYDDDSEIGCTARRPADISDIWEMERLRRIPKLGRTGLENVTVYVRDDDGTVYRIDYQYLGYDRSGTAGASEFTDDVFVIQMDLYECFNDSCSRLDNLVENMDVYLDRVSDFGSWEGNVQRHPMSGGGYFSQQAGIQATNTCNGIEPNEDLFFDEEPYRSAGTTSSTDDAWWDYPYKMEWRLDPRGEEDIDGTTLAERVPYLDYGDIIPLDWEHKNNDNVRRRLAPNAWQLTSDSVASNSIIELESTGEIADYRSAAYFNDEYVDYAFYGGSRRRLRLRDESERPLLARGSTPLFQSLRDFEEWYVGPSDCDRTSEDDPPCGWRAYAEVFDLNWACKQKYVLMLTDGDETCDSVSSACTIANTLFDSYQVQTFVVGFGLAEGSGDALTCIAENGGTGEPIYPRNKQDLVDRLLAVFDEVKAESRAFASASIPAVQSTAADKIYLSSFTPIPGTAIWPGRVDVFRQPLPLDDDRRPQVTLECNAERQSGCHLYEVAEQLLEQAPDNPGDASLEAPERYEIRVGRDDELTTDVAEDESINVTSRRVFIGQENNNNVRPGPLRLVWPPDRESTYPDAAIDRLDLAEALVSEDDLAIYYACATGDCEATLDVALQDSVRRLVEVREESITDGEGNEIPCLGDPDDLDNTPCRYVMGDVFHANPQVIGSPNDFDFFRQDLCGTPPAPGQPNNCVPAETFSSAADMRARGYREFVRRNVWRRRTLVTATNDGQLHFFDAGKYIAIEDENLGEVEVFTDGTGHEMFSYIPRLVAPILRDQLHGDQHIYSLDGSPRLGDVFIDPVPNTSGEYQVEHREWRTVMIGGLREAGSVFNSFADVTGFSSGYYALDLTYPDEVVQAVDEEGNVRPFAPYVPAEPGKFLPTCLEVDDESGRQASSTAPGCRTLSGESVPFPLELWTFQDTITIDGAQYFLDMDRNNFRDLGDTWSVPVIGQVAVCRLGGTMCAAGQPGDGTDDDVETRWVAMFGGGLDPQNINNPQRGTRFYIVDIETGNVLLSRQVDGAVPSDPAAVDVDNDGIIDRVYFGTTEGTLYKLQLRATTGDVPSIEELTLNASQILGWTPPDSDRPTVERVTSTAWEPFPIFDAGAPIYYPPAIFKIPSLEQYGLAFGVGAREDLWEESGFEGAFHVLVDQDFEAGDSTLPFDDESLVHFDWQASDPEDFEGTPVTGLDASGNLLLTDFAATGFRPGWIMDFPADFKTTNEAFVLSGILIFSVFDPLTVTIDNQDAGTDAVCAQTGTTYSFVVSLQNGTALADLGGCDGRCEVIDEFTTAVHTDRTVSKNPPSDNEEDSTSLGDNTGSTIDEELANAIREAILELSPRSCQYNENYEVVVSALRNSTGLNVYAKIPFLICPGDFRDSP